MTKKGTLFERAVSDIVRGFGDVSDVVQGDWIIGPDGRRDRDVRFNVLVRTRRYKALIECKDYNRASTGPVGIGLIDALDSKRRDLGIDIAMICSNAGFTKGARRKAQRVGIRTIGALRMDDDRIRFEVSDVIYTRKITISDVALHMRFGEQEIDLSQVSTWDVRYGGDPVGKWAMERIYGLLALNPVVNGKYRLSHGLSSPLIFNTPRGDVSATRLDASCRITGAWYEFEVKIDATNGLYDWIRRRVQSTGGAAHQIKIGELDMAGGTWVARPPEHVTTPLPVVSGETDLRIFWTNGPLPQGTTAPLNQHVRTEDLDLKINSYPSDTVTSTRGYVHPPAPDAPARGQDPV